MFVAYMFYLGRKVALDAQAMAATPLCTSVYIDALPSQIAEMITHLSTQQMICTG
jgi:hypothetical protein